MNRHLIGILLAAGIVVVATQRTVFSDDKVERRQGGQIVSVSGKIVDETVAGVKIKAGMKETLIPATEISRVFYDDLPIASKQAYINLWNMEDAEKDQAKVYKAYQDFQPKVAQGPPAIRRNVEYRLATLQASIADTKEQKTEARKALAAFVANHGTGWQYAVAARLLGRMQVDAAEFETAQRTLEGLSKSNVVPAEIRQEADLMLVDVLFQAGKIDDLKTKITAAMADPKTTEQQKTRFNVYQAAIEAKAPNAKVEDVIKNLEGLIAKTADNAVKGLAYNVMGDCYAGSSLKDARRQAMWSYLWVDVVYNQDRSEHIKAMNSLLKIFEEDKDTEKAQLYKEKLARFR